MIALSYAQLVAGCSLPYLQEVASNRSYVPTSWLGNIRTFLQLCNGKLIIPNAQLPHTQREHDQVLMDVFESAKPSPTTLEQLNMVQLYLGVLTLADIASDDGWSILPCGLSGCNKVKPMIPWPNQVMPPSSCWITWRRFLK
eukprot:14383988-Ditylum_brightwellii.AAC.1